MRRVITFILSASTFISSTLVAQAHSRRAMTTDDGLNMVTIGNVLMSPDGQWVFYSTSELDWDENKRKTTYHMVPSSGGETFQYIGEEGGSNFSFSPQGTYLAFTRSVKDTNQIFLMRTTGGEAVQLTKHDTAIQSYVWGSDERTIYFLSDNARTTEERKRHKDGDDALYIDEGANGQRQGAWQSVWNLNVATKEERRLTSDEVRISSFDVSPDQSQIVYIRRTENRRNQSNQGEIYLLALGSGEETRLTNNEAPETDVSWSPDGLHISYRAPSNGGWDLRLARIWVMNTHTKETRVVSEEFAGNISQTDWNLDGTKLLFTGLQRTNANLFQLDVRSGNLEQLTHLEGAFRAYAYSRDRKRMAYTFEDFNTPADLYSSALAEFQPVQLTQLNPWIDSDIVLGDARIVRWQSRDGTSIEGILVLPPSFVGGARLPFLLHVHGGPAGVFTNSFRTSIHVWSGLGYAQLLPNVRGSSGYDDALLRGNMRDIGGGDFQDLITGVDYVISEGIADPNQMGIRGWSYGGILGGWTITQTDRFKAASLGAMVSDWTSEYGPGFNYDVRNWYIGGTPWESPDRYRQLSALTHVANVTTPTLIMHGAADPTDTEQQSMMFFQALRDQDKAVRYIQFPREPHGFREPRHQRTRDIEEIKWMQQYVRGIEWTPWERPSSTDSTKTAVTTQFE